MTNVTARTKINGKNFEILVDVDKAIQLKKGANVSITEVLALNKIFSDSKKGLAASEADVQSAFNTLDFYEIAKKIVLKGEVQIPSEYKNKEREEKLKQIIDFISRNAVDPVSGKPHSFERIRSAIEESNINIENKPIEDQVGLVIEKISKLIPIKIETKKLSVKVPAVYSGKAYGLLQKYKEKEEWQNDGSLLCIINLPSGLQFDFYDKINAISHGSIIVEEIKK